MDQLQPQMKQYSTGSNKVTVFSSCLWQTTSTIVHGENRLFLFDPAYLSHEIEQIVSYVNEMRNGVPLILVFTHGDWDHIAGFAPFADALVVAHQEMIPNERRELQIQKAREFDERFYVQRTYPLEVPRIDKVISSEEQTNEWGVAFIPVPGHTKDMMATFFPEERTVVVGDMLSALEFPFVYHDSLVYIHSLERMKQLVTDDLVDLLIAGHGVPAVSKEEMLARIERDLRYLEEGRAVISHGCKSGIEEAEIHKIFASMMYDGKSIHSRLAERHEDNFKQIFAEMQE